MESQFCDPGYVTLTEEIRPLRLSRLNIKHRDVLNKMCQIRQTERILRGPVTVAVHPRVDGIEEMAPGLFEPVT
ncbi:MAG: hypothetical protein CL471_04970 [Acidobacteria bacterium]|nr:hypothetical protein [Acidobacteriota bacterium]